MTLAYTIDAISNGLFKGIPAGVRNVGRSLLLVLTFFRCSALNSCLEFIRITQGISYIIIP